MSAMTYRAFLHRKAQLADDGGFEPLWLPDFLFDFQRALVEWSVRKGRGAVFSDCGTGKTPMELVWAENVVRRTVELKPSYYRQARRNLARAVEIATQPEKQGAFDFSDASSNETGALGLDDSEENAG